MDMQMWRNGRIQADDAVSALREALAALGVPEHVQRQLRPMVTHSGTPFVHVGMIRAEHVARISEALRAAAGTQKPTASTPEARS